jgi:hypothetical protein
MVGFCLLFVFEALRVEIGQIGSIFLTVAFIAGFGGAHACRKAVGDSAYLRWFACIAISVEFNAWIAWDTPTSLGPAGSVLARIVMPIVILSGLWLHSVIPIWERSLRVTEASSLPAKHG